MRKYRITLLSRSVASTAGYTVYSGLTSNAAYQIDRNAFDVAVIDRTLFLLNEEDEVIVAYAAGQWLDVEEVEEEITDENLSS